MLSATHASAFVVFACQRCELSCVRAVDTVTTMLVFAAAELAELRRREQEAGITADPALDAFMDAMSIQVRPRLHRLPKSVPRRCCMDCRTHALGDAAAQGQDHSVATEYIIRMLGLEVCADTPVGSAMIRGISGGQRKRVTSGEMLVSAKRVRAEPLARWSIAMSSSCTSRRAVSQLTHR